MVKTFSGKYKYPPEKADGAVNIVIEQAELMSVDIQDFKECSYDFRYIHVF